MMWTRHFHRGKFYWHAVVEELIRQEEVAMGVRCKSCGQNVQALAPGTMVESRVFGDYKIGPVASSAVVRAYAEKYRSFVGDRVAFIDIKSGALCFREQKDVTVVHGWLHVERGWTCNPQEKF